MFNYLDDGLFETKLKNKKTVKRLLDKYGTLDNFKQNSTMLEDLEYQFAQGDDIIEEVEQERQIISSLPKTDSSSLDDTDMMRNASIHHARNKQNTFEDITTGLSQDFLDIAYGVNRGLNGLTAGGLDYLGDKFGFDSKMNNYLNLLSPQERKQRENIASLVELGGNAMLGNRALETFRAPYNSWQIGRAYDRLSQNPYQGSGSDVVTRMKNHNNETVLLQRGEAIRGENGEVITSGRLLRKVTGTERNRGLNKAIYKHGMSRKQVKNIPQSIKSNPVEVSPRGQDVYKINTPEGEITIVATPINGKKTISTMYLVER